MSTYIVNCGNDNSYQGTYANLGDAQTAAVALRDARVAEDPSNLSSQNTSTCYASIRTLTGNSGSNEMSLAFSKQRIDRLWDILVLDSV